MIRLTVNVDFAGLEKFEKLLSSDLRFKQNKHIAEMLQEWNVIYAEFIFYRYIRFSQGGGSWPPLKKSTVKRKIKKYGRNLGILRATDTTLNEIDPKFSRKPSKLDKSIPFGIRVGFNAPQKHPEADMTIGQLASIHHFGLGNVPERKILVAPSSDVRRKMTQAADSAIDSVTASFGLT